jgi:pimeloyl-ACP methyl ester carboxylesterase
LALRNVKGRHKRDMLMTRFLKLFVAAYVVLFAGGPVLALQTSEAGQPTIKQMTIPSVTLTYQEQGQGETVLFIHGSFSDYRIWEPMREAIAENYHFVAPSLRYHGTGAWPDEGTNYSAATHINDLAALIRHLDVGPVHVVGRSSGASLALMLAVQHPELVRSLYIHEPGLDSLFTNPTDELWRQLDELSVGFDTVFEASEAGDQRKTVQLFVEWVNDQPGLFETLKPWQRKMFLENARTIPLQFSRPPDPPITCDQVGEIDIPVTIAKGELTRGNFAMYTDVTHRCMPGSQLVTIPNARHSTLENPSAVKEAIISHLESAS